ncbi:hypothetical protein ASG93_25710 [Paenibacillus sp. Soil787]|nr:hypothetical protein ASG93_25710 [Paenibacillus sp. Soil787]
MIDTHCHILPGLDDGAGSLEEAVEMAIHAANEGIHTIVATPHHGDGRHDNDASAVGLAVQELNLELETRNIPVQILPGQEVRVYKGLLDDLEAGTIRTLNDTQYLLLEMPSYGVPDYVEDLLYELHIQGLTVMIAHPERNIDFIKDPRRLQQLVGQGCLCQITSQSIMGLFGRKIQRFAIQLCKKNLTHTIASDAHNMANRKSDLSVAFSYLEKHISYKAVENYILNASRIVHNESIMTESYQYKKKIWSFI